MKISNEVKIGIIVLTAAVLFIVSFQFLKGKSLFNTGFTLIATYNNTHGILLSDPVMVNGYKVGSVSQIQPSKNFTQIHLTLKFNEPYNIPKNSIACIQRTLIGNASINIILGDAAAVFSLGDSIRTSNEMDKKSIGGMIAPLSDQLKNTMQSVNIVLASANSLLSPSTIANFQGSVANLNRTSATLQQLMNQQANSIAATIENANKLSQSMTTNSEKITTTIDNINKCFDTNTQTNITASVAQLKLSLQQFNKILTKVNSTESTAGKLLNDTTLHTHLLQTLASIDLLTNDIRLHPKRYINVSVFGSKDKREKKDK